MMTIIAIGRSLPFCAYRPTRGEIRGHRAFRVRDLPALQVVVRWDLLEVRRAWDRWLADLAGEMTEVSDYRVDHPGVLRVLEVPAASDGVTGVVAQDLVLCHGSALIGPRTEARPWPPPLGTGLPWGCNEAGAGIRADSPGRDPFPTDQAEGNAREYPSRAVESIGKDAQSVACAPDVGQSCTDAASSRDDTVDRQPPPPDFASSSLPPCCAC